MLIEMTRDDAAAESKIFRQTFQYFPQYISENL